MAQSWAKDFYNSPAWKRTRKAYAESQHWLCERCRARGEIARGEIVHHKRHLTRRNITDTTVTLNFSNLELLCRDCHNKHHNSNERLREGFFFDADGNIRPYS